MEKDDSRFYVEVLPSKQQLASRRTWHLNKEYAECKRTKTEVKRSTSKTRGKVKRQ